MCVHVGTLCEWTWRYKYFRVPYTLFFHLGVPFLSPSSPSPSLLIIWDAQGFPSKSLGSWKLHLPICSYSCYWTGSLTRRAIWSLLEISTSTNCKQFLGLCAAPTIARQAASCTASACRLIGACDRDRGPTVPHYIKLLMVRLYCAP